MNDKEVFVRSVFDDIVEKYDLLNTVLSAGMDRGWRRRLIKECAPRPGASCLDLCTGTGEVALLLQKAVGGEGSVEGIDFCAGMVDRAREKYPEEKFPGLRFSEGDAMKTVFPDDSFDIVTSAFALRNVKDLDGFFRETHRVLKMGGICASLELTRPANPILRVLYFPYLKGFLPVIGGMVSGSLKAYKYLSSSISGFIGVEEVRSKMEIAGFSEIRIIPLMGGIATIHVGRK